MNLDALKARVHSALPEELRTLSGTVLYSRWATLQKGDLYIAGLNPAGTPETHPGNVEQSLARDLCAYTGEGWREDGKQMIHQRRVERLAANLGYKIDDVFAANAIFPRTVKETPPLEFRRLWDLCWPVHERIFLPRVRPILILCLGNGAKLSAFEFFKSKVRDVVEQSPVVNSSAQGRWVRGTIYLAAQPALPTTVVGIPHPSWHAPQPALIERLRELLRSPQGEREGSGGSGPFRS